MKRRSIDNSFTALLPEDRVLEGVRDYLEIEALGDSSGCWGYYPALETEAPQALEEFVATSGHQTFSGRQFSLSFVRLALGMIVPIGGQKAMHVDNVSSTGLVMEDDSSDEMVLLRALVNLDPTRRKRTAFTFEPINQLMMVEYPDTSFRTCTTYDPRKRFNVELFPRQGIVFDASGLLHAGADTEDGHFVAAWHTLVPASEL